MTVDVFGFPSVLTGAATTGPNLRGFPGTFAGALTAGPSLSGFVGLGPTISAAKCVALFQFDGTGTAFIDSGPNRFTVSAAGSATQTTTAGTFGGGKALICATGTADYVEVAGNALFSLTDFTVNMRVQFTSNTFTNVTVLEIGGYDVGLSMRANGVAADRMSVYITSANTNPSFSWVANTWHEVEIGRQSATTYIFVDGELLVAASLGTTAWAAAPALRVGMAIHTPGAQDAGRKFDDVLVANTCLHTAAYIPRTAAFTLV